MSHPNFRLPMLFPCAWSNGSSFQRFLMTLSHALLLAALAIIAGCHSSSDNRPDPVDPDAVDVVGGSVALSSFGSDHELETFLKSQFTGGSDTTGLSPPGESFSADSAEAPSAENFSETNVQEEGVDEADKVKSDGRYLYVAADGEVKIVRARPVESMSVVAAVPVSGHIRSLYLNDNQLIILYDGDAGSMSEVVGDERWIPTSGIVFVDVADPAQPQIQRHTVAEGRMISSRRVDSSLHVVMEFNPLPYFFSPLAEPFDVTLGANSSRDDSRLPIAQRPLEELLPRYYELDLRGQPMDSGRLVPVEALFHPDLPGGVTQVSVLTFDLNLPSEPFKSVGYVGDVDMVYGSRTALYLVKTLWASGGIAVAPSLPSPTVRTTLADTEATVVHKLALTNGKATIVASGAVNGRLLNQYSLGEYEGVLRVATTTGFNESNNVFLLQAVDGALEIVGSLENIAPGERIYSARFMGDRGFLVTFKKVDPLFTLDLSDSQTPQLVGELKVPGYSDYIHPLGDDHLLTIGKDAEDQGSFAWYQGVQISVFDVRNFAQPQLGAKEIIGSRGTESEALRDPKAFTYWAERGLLGFPIQLAEGGSGGSDFGEYTFSGLYIYRVATDSGFELLGRLETGPANAGWHSWTRTVFIDDRVYGITKERIVAAPVEDIEGSVLSLSLVED